MSGQIARLPITFDTWITKSQEWGFTFPSRHLRASASYRGQSRQFILGAEAMLAHFLIASATLQTPQTVQIDLKRDAFVVTGPSGPETVPLRQTPKVAQDKFALKDGDHWVVWDQRGLTVRVGTHAKTTRLPDVATSLKANTREQIAETIDKIQRGERTREAAALSGFELVGEQLYLLVRWEEKGGAPWMECVVRVDLATKSNAPVFVGRMPAVSKASGPVADELFLTGGKLATIAVDGPQWGLAFWDVAESFGRFVGIGSGLARHSVQPDGASVLFVEDTGYRTQLGGVAQLPSGERRNLVESAGRVSFVSAKPIVARIDDDLGVALRFAGSGLEQRFAKGTEARACGYGLLVWSPKEAPLRAALFPGSDWIPSARWSPAQSGKTP